MVYVMFVVSFLGSIYLLIKNAIKQKRGVIQFFIILNGLFFILGLSSLRFMFTWLLLIPLQCSFFLKMDLIPPFFIKNKYVSHSFKIMTLIIGGVIIVSKFTLTPLDNRAMGFGIDNRVLPVRSLMYCEELQHSKNLFNHASWGGLLSFYLPSNETKIFMNGFVTDTALLQFYINTLHRTSETTMKVIENELNIDTMFLKKNNSALISWLQLSQDWKMVYEDLLVIVFQKNSI